MRTMVAFCILWSMGAAAAGATPEIDPTTASLEEILDAAEEAFQADEEERGEAFLGAAVERFPDNEDLAEYRAGFYLYRKDFDRALEITDNWLAAHPGDGEWLHFKTWPLLKLGRDAEALAILEELASHDPQFRDEARIYFDIGDIYARGEAPDHAKAAAAYEEGLTRIEPSERIPHPDVFYNLACSYARLGEKGKALDSLRGALEAEARFAREAKSDEDLASLRGDPAFEELIAAAAARAAEEEKNNMSIKPGEAAPDFTLADIEGKEHRLSGYRGKPVVLNIWATWCPPCRQEIPDIIEFARDHDGDVVVLSLSVDDPGEDVAALAAEYGINYPVLRDDGEAAEKYLHVGQGIPQTYFIDDAGVVRRHIYGSASRDVFEERLRTLLSP